ncbi:MAG: hypothetical protein K0R30_2952 [Ornithinibacter sp.]|jgi:hypothetical protein|nr:hypothetical protein [Ornithinibacter sp.]
MTTPEPAEVRRSPDGKLLAWYSGGHHYSWLANDGHNRTAEDVADWTPLVPAVSESPVDTDGMTDLVLVAHAELDHCVRGLLSALNLAMPDRPLDAVWTTLLEIVQQQETRRLSLAASAMRDREEVKAARAERDALSQLLRDMARTSFLVAACQDCPEVTAGSAEQVNDWANAHRAATGRVNRLSAGPAVPEDTGEQQ